MKFLNGSLYLLIGLLCNFSFSQQVTIDDTYSPQQLIENSLIQGCVETSNIFSQINGSVNGFASFGYFEKGTSEFPFQNGIMLSTGRAVSGGNGQNNNILNEGQTDWLTDPDLETALGISNTLNATSIEFDFVSISNLIEFNYILASEEYYQNFPCQYSDGFAFLIKKAGTSDPYVNIALIPGTNTPVNTNTIHPAIAGFCPAAHGNYFAGYNLGDTNYNGRTKVLTASANIIPNITYNIKLVIADQSDKNYDSAVFIEGNSFNATVDLGEDLTTCADSHTLNGSINNPSATYSWYYNGSLISDASEATLTIYQSGTYTVMVEMPLAGNTCMIEDSIEVSLSSTQTANPIPDYELCDNESMDGIGTFDLSTRDDDVLASVPSSNYAISYHYSSSNAENNSNPIVAPIQNSTNNQIIYVRIEDTINGCLAYTTFHLVVNPLPNITPPGLLMICDDADSDGITQIDLNENDDAITNGQSDFIVTYHLSQAAADSGSNPIPMPFVNTSPAGEVFVRVVNPETGCFRTTTLSYEVLGSPTINYEDVYIDACDQDHDGMATFDLNEVIDEIVQGLNNVTVTFHETLEDAESGTNPIPNPNTYNNTSANEQIVYIRVEDETTGCASVRPFEIHSNLLLTGTNINDFSVCDEDADNIEQFDLNEIATEIINGLEDVSVTFYASETDRDNQINALNPNVAFVPEESPTLLYLTITSMTCVEVAQIELVLNEITIFPQLEPTNYCDSDDDGFTLIDLHSFDDLLTNGLDGYTVTYYGNLTDAEANNNPLPDFYTNTSNPQTFYPKISATDTGCGSINPFEINVLPAPTIGQPDDIVICDSDQDGYANVDLTQVYGQLVTDMTDREISFYFTNSDLVNGTNAFTDVANYYTNSIVVYTKVTNTNTGCYSKVHFYIEVNTMPLIPEISDYDYCEEATDDIGDFIFSDKDPEILNGQIGKQTLYFLTQEDAINRQNEIDKEVPFQNTVNPQTIYVRVENLTDISCFDTSSFKIRIGTNPLFNAPTDMFLCDDISNDGTEVFDLESKISEITQGINESLTVSFHKTEGRALNGTNPLPLQYANIVNPQQIYVRISNGNICVSVTSFTLNVVQVASANPATPLEACDTDYDGIVTFDLTQSLIEILDVRQDNLAISYFRTMADLDSQENPINDPTAYNNQSNPQTVYVRLTNVISDVNGSNCYLAIPLELKVNLPPAINTFGDVNVCDNETHYYDLLEVNDLLVNDTTNTIISYHTSNAEALSASNPLDTDYYYTSNTTMLYARIEIADTGCFITYGFRMLVKPLPLAYTANDLEACDDDFDGLLEFDLSTQTNTVLGNQNPSNFTVTYHDSQGNAASGSNDLPNTYMAFDTQIIYVRVENNATECYNISQFTINVLPKPLVDIPDQVICLENLPLVVSANTNNPSDSYLWSTGETTPEIEITLIGTYAVTVTNEYGCETTQVFNVTESEQATIEIVDTIDFSDPNNITITISGIGDYMYQLDDHVPQESNVFENVAIGYHIITIIDLNGCLEISKEVLVLDFPKFMTPNDDGYFDTWHIIGVETLPGTVIYIYDRFGKQITFLTATSQGWDGTYNGHNMPSSDYWFVADVKGGGHEFQAKGHFALKR